MAMLKLTFILGGKMELWLVISAEVAELYKQKCDEPQI